MSNKKISELETLETVAGGDFVAVVDISETDITKATKKATKDSFKGDTGATGAAATATAGTTTTGAPGSSASVVNSGTTSAAVFDFTIPRGDVGATGPVGATWKGAYNGATAYVANDLVSYSGSTYICILASTGNLPTNGTYWSLVAQKGAGDVIAPATNTDAYIPQWNGANSKTLKDGVQLDTDGTLAGNSDTRVATQKAVKTYADTKSDASKSETLTNKTLTKPIINASVPGYQTYTPDAGGTATLDLALANRHLITMPAGNITIALSNGTTGQYFQIGITQDSGGSRTVTWFTTIKWSGGTAPTLTTTASKRDTFGFFVTGANTYDGYVIGQNI